jgi:hypothetical protein
MPFTDLHSTMKTSTTYIFLSILVLAGMVTACDSFVSDVEDPIDTVTDDQLSSAEQVPFVITGVQRQFALASDNAGFLGDLLADAAYFDTDLQDATFPTYREIDEADIPTASNSVDTYYNDLGELRFFSDNLVNRVQDNVEFSSDQQGLRSKALYVGHFYGAMARYYYAAHIGLNPTEPGGVINAGPFVPAAEMYDRALADLDSAETNNVSGMPNPSTIGATTDLRSKYISTLRARIHLFSGEYGEAASAATNGLSQGDASLSAQYSVEENNGYYFASGPGRSQIAYAERYSTYQGAVVYESETAGQEVDRSNVRIPLYAAAATDAAADESGQNRPFYVQAKHLTQESPLEVLSWEENALILAELAAVHGQDISGNPFGTTDPLELINLVRTQYNDVSALSSGTTVDQALILEERDKEFFATTGLRLVDMRRTGQTFIRQQFDPASNAEVNTGEVPGPWRVLPITDNERNQNENFN